MTRRSNTADDTPKPTPASFWPKKEGRYIIVRNTTQGQREIIAEYTKQSHFSYEGTPIDDESVLSWVTVDGSPIE